MLSVYPFGSGSLYTATRAVSSSFAISASLVPYSITASNAGTVLYPESGSRGKGVCLLTREQYNLMVASSSVETCNFNV